MFRCDWVPKGSFSTQTTWHTTLEAAETAVWRLGQVGVTYAVAWFDAGAVA